MAKYGILVLFHTFAVAKNSNVPSTNTPQNVELNMSPSTDFTFLDFLDELLDENNALSNDRTESKNHTEDCLAVMVESYSMNKSGTTDTEWFCEDKNHLLYKIKGLGPDILDDEKLISGVSHIISNDAKKKVDLKSPEDDEIVLDEKNVYIQKNENNAAERDLGKSSGTKTLLMLRVHSLDGQPTSSAAQMSQLAFGSYKGSFALQVAGCSKGKLKYVPASGKDIVNGVMEISIPNELKGMNDKTASNLVEQAAQKKYGSFPWKYDHIMVVVQPDVKHFTAWARVNSWYSFYSDSYFKKPMVIFHELGHNMGLLHSNEDKIEYGDSTGLMGGTGNIFRCFNGAKSWFLNWYSDRQALVKPTKSNAWLGKIVGVNDYTNGETSSDHSVVAKVRTVKDIELYIMLNKKEGINSNTVEYGDFVTVVQAKNDNISHRSNLLAVLGGGDAIDYDETVIRVCGTAEGKPDYATVMVYLKSDENSKVVKDKCNNSCGSCKSNPIKFSSCNDGNSNCKNWEKLGYCKKRYVTFMKTNCKDSCGFCPSSQGVKKFISPLACKDAKSNCKNWVKLGYCKERYVAYMKANCKDSCGFCPAVKNPVKTPVNVPVKTPVRVPVKKPVKTPVKVPVKKPVTACKDANSNCKYWVKLGYCEKRYVAYMKANCKDSCGFCTAVKNPVKTPVKVPVKKPVKTPVKVPVKKPVPVCKDKYSLRTCTYYEKFCEKYASIKANCSKTCGSCGNGNNNEKAPVKTPVKAPVTVCKDKYSLRTCTYYEKHNFCKRYASVKKNCSKTCGSCGN